MNTKQDLYNLNIAFNFGRIKYSLSISILCVFNVLPLLDMQM